MNEKFFELKKEKQDRMINAALKVFSEYGYYHASTDEIVKNAEISKGLLFHYFGSKIGIYAFLYDYATRFVTLELTANVEKNENGYFELYHQILSAKVAAMSQYPYIFLYLNKADEEKHPEAVAEISERREKYQRIMEALRERADITQFAPFVDYNKVGEILDFTINGLMVKRIKSASFRSDLFLQEAEEYIDMIKAMSLMER
ncbi:MULTISPECIES: TetR/AcrR family transcriptional regulator [unclassified Butyrivibrio]|jgi:AcrR family transcriptional regulator|uniref:TetR/AcrR family transcriptional regulator n=1 Tax=unclassified Butyrivibrio TaxID=2639466 RepID=UPI00040933E0|nr:MULTISPECIES: TetR/AcrR family transcriptional regulator [unclassified Butyrivibrio]SCY01887.1 transcriptional regulator, TetR family [Butyrivibrio sp. INlla14]